MIALLHCLVVSLSVASHTAHAANLASGASDPAVVVVEGDFLGRGADYMRPQMEQHTRTMYAALDAGGVRHRATKDSLVAKNGVPRAKVAILPYNRAISSAESGKLLEFINAGGKIIVCFLAPPELLAALGVQADDIVTGPFDAMTFSESAVVGLPQEVSQPSDKLRACSPRRNARTLGYWRTRDGKTSNRPAVILSENGAYISHVLLAAGDRQAQGALMRALCGHFAPRIWQDAIPASAKDIRPLGNYDSLEHMRAKLLERQRAGEDVSRAMGAVGEVLRRIEQARKALAGSNLDEAMQLAAEIDPLAKRAYWMSYPSRNGELRGVWACNDATPDWDTAVRGLRESNLNAVFPYICSAGVAWYDSELLPRESSRDYLLEASRAGRRYGIPVHARMINLYAMCAPESFKEKLREEGRLMVSGSGKTTNWLCPVNPQNRRLQARVAAEIVRKYPVTGLQLDYLRYPGEEYCLCAICRREFQKRLGRELDNVGTAVKSGKVRRAFLEWRCQQTTLLVRDIRDAVRKARPDAVFSAAVFLNWEDHRDTFGQDWKVWVDQGLVDFVCPMDYTPSNKKFTEYVQRQIKWVDGKVPLCPGLGVNADNMQYGGPQTLLDQVTIARNLKTDGWAVFNLDDNFVRNYLPYLRLGATSTPSAFSPFTRSLMGPVNG